MTLDISFYRLHNQRLSPTSLTQPADVVGWLGAVQSQDFGGAKWAIGLRAIGLTESEIEGAFADGSILRTHVLRPTWHFVTPTDIRWMLTLTAPYVRASLAYMDRKLELDKVILKKSNAVLTKALRGAKQLTRADLGSALQKNGINTNDLRLGHILMHAELDGVICSGARQGKQFTYALLEERVPPAKVLGHEEALAELAQRYFMSHGPATVKDFTWWSGLPAAEARHGLDMAKEMLEHETVEGETYWFISPSTSSKRTAVQAYFLPNYDEFTVGYTDRSAIFDANHGDKLGTRGGLLQNVILLSGRVIGTWKRSLQKNSLTVETNLFREIRKREMHALIEAAERYGMFLGLPFALTFANGQ